MRLFNKAKLASRILGLSCLLGGSILATPLVAESYLIKQASLHTATAKGVIHQADILIKDGKIVQLGESITAPADAKVIEAKGKHVTPGLINAATNMGIVEIGAVSATVDATTSKKTMGASFNISPAVNFVSTLIPQNRINGLTRAIVLPNQGESLFAGQGAAIALHSSMKGMLNEKVAQLAVYGIAGANKAGGSRAAAMQLLDRALRDTAYLRRNEAGYLPGFKWEFSQSIEDLKALYPVLDRAMPLIIQANRADDILRLITLAKKHKVRLVISGGAEAWKVAEQLAAARVPVIIDPILNMPHFDALSIRLDGAARLYQAGVKLLFTGGDTHNAYLVRQSAGNAVAYGMPPEAAIEAMTINTAEVFGLKNYGQLKPGMDADIVLWDGDPLELTSNPDMVLIQGELQPLVSRATRLRDRYWKLNTKQQKAFWVR